MFKSHASKPPYVGLIVLAVKLFPKFISPLVKIIPKLLKGGKAFQVGSAGVSMGAWSLLLSWQFALLIMLLLVVHESGHVWAMKRSGMKTKGIYFIPFLGGAAVAEDMFPSRRTEVFVAIMGPIWGLALSVVALSLWFALDWPHFAAAAAWMATVNLFNLLPINPLDGGRIFKSVVFSINSWLGLAFLALGLAATGYLIVRLHLWLFIILLALGAVEFGWEWVAHKRKRGRGVELEGFNESHAMGSEKTHESAIARYAHRPSMGKHGIFASIGIYGIVAITLYLVMTLGSKVPGAGNPIQIFS